jgi:hypothetical protein
MLPALPPLTLTFTTNGLALCRLATFALGDKVAVLFHVAHDAILGNALAKAAEQALQCLAWSSFNFRHPFIILLYIVLCGIRLLIVRCLYSQKRICSSLHTTNSDAIQIRQSISGSQSGNRPR